MAMGRRKDTQGEFWVASRDLSLCPGHPFYERLNELLDAVGFDRVCESLREVRNDKTVSADTSELLIEEVVADKGYHSSQTLVDLEEIELRPYLSEPDRGRRSMATVGGVAGDDRNVFTANQVSWWSGLLIMPWTAAACVACT